MMLQRKLDMVDKGGFKADSRPGIFLFAMLYTDWNVPKYLS